MALAGVKGFASANDLEYYKYYICGMQNHTFTISVACSTMYKFPDTIEFM